MMLDLIRRGDNVSVIITPGTLTCPLGWQSRFQNTAFSYIYIFSPWLLTCRVGEGVRLLSDLTAPLDWGFFFHLHFYVSSRGSALPTTPLPIILPSSSTTSSLPAASSCFSSPFELCHFPSPSWEEEKRKWERRWRRKKKRLNFLRAACHVWKAFDGTSRSKKKKAKKKPSNTRECGAALTRLKSS